MGGIFPGAPTLAEFWQLIEQGRDTCRDVPAGRWLLDPQLIPRAPPGTPDAVSSRRGCYIEEYPCAFSAAGLPHESAGPLDPMFHLLLHAGRAAYAAARTEKLERSRVGIILGNIALPTAGASTLCDEILQPWFASMP